MEDTTGKAIDNAMAFQKMWLDTLSKLAVAGLSVTPGAPPPEYARQMRSGVFNALAQSWDEFMRTPQFMEAMKQSMDGAIAFRKMSKDALNRVHHEVQGAAKEDIDAIMINIRHLETRVLDRLEIVEDALKETQAQVAALDGAGDVNGTLTEVLGRLDDLQEGLAGLARPSAPARKTPAKKAVKKTAKKTARKTAAKRSRK